MKKMILLLLVLIIALELCGCESKVPERLRNSKTEYLQIVDFQKSEFFIPPNYRLIDNGVYAVLGEEGHITGYMKLIKENGEYRWEESTYGEAHS